MVSSKDVKTVMVNKVIEEQEAYVRLSIPQHNRSVSVRHQVRRF